MTDKFRVLHVLLDNEYRDDYLEKTLIPAIKLLKGVTEVTTQNIDNFAIFAARSDLRRELADVLVDVFKND